LPLTVRASLLSPPGELPFQSYLSDLMAGEADPPDLLFVGVRADEDAEPGAGDPAATQAGLDSLLPVPAPKLLAAYGHGGAPGELAETAVAAGGQTLRVAFLGIGDGTPAALRRAGAEAGRRCRGGKTAAADLTGCAAADVAAFAEGVLLGGYQFSLRSQPPDDTGPVVPGPVVAGPVVADAVVADAVVADAVVADAVMADAAGESGAASGATAGTDPIGHPGGADGALTLLVADAGACEGPVRRAQVIAGAVALARDLANSPSLGKSPHWLADEAARRTAECGVRVRIWPAQELAAAGFGGILAVGSGSARPPALIELSYDPPAAQAHIVLVGKGITFDSGGLSLKPNDNMMLMKTDMAGGGAVIAVMTALAELGVRSRVTGLVAAAENMPSGSSYRPGDVISQYGGTTVEVLNTDAEGRIVLADALAYAVAELAPDQIVDIATLTGAARVGLGTTHAALYATGDSLAAELLAAGQASGDALWRMPLEDEYRPSLDSPVADIAHVARDHNPAGSIIAALFLREFAGRIPWAHLDIAGPGRSGAEDGERSKGATGFGTRLLLTWLAPDPA
jgi:leucyl aminopeptidase